MGADGADYGEGYVVDVEYTAGFHAGLAPLDLAFAALLNGAVPPDVDQHFRYLDLGCGNGLNAALIAAGHPHAEVWGADFNPAHIRTAQATAAMAGTGNATFVEASFADLLDRSMPPFDVVVAHGIWSWVNQENRGRIAALLHRIVKPGGLVMISYNCHPGWDPLVPLRTLLMTAAQDVTNPHERVERSLALALTLRDTGADYFRNNVAASDMLDALLGADRAYVAHEFLNSNWTLFHPDEVADAVAPAGLRRLGSTRTIDAFEELWITAGERALIERERTSTAAPMLRDLILNRRFRLDLFARDATALDAAAAAAWYDERRFVLARARADCSLTIRTRVGETTLPSLPAEFLLDALADGPATGAELVTRPEFAGTDGQQIRRTLAMLVATGNVRLALAATGEAARRVSTDRFNHAALAGVRMGEPAPALASPVTGSGEVIPASEQLMLDALRFGIPLDAILLGDDPDAAIRFRDNTLPAIAMLGIA